MRSRFLKRSASRAITAEDEMATNHQQIRKAQRMAASAVLYRNQQAWEEAKRLFAVAIGRILH